MQLVVSKAVRTVPYPLLGENTLVLSDSLVLAKDENGALALMFRSSPFIVPLFPGSHSEDPGNISAYDRLQHVVSDTFRRHFSAVFTVYWTQCASLHMMCFLRLACSARIVTASWYLWRRHPRVRVTRSQQFDLVVQSWGHLPHTAPGCSAEDVPVSLEAQEGLRLWKARCAHSFLLYSRSIHVIDYQDGS